MAVNQGAGGAHAATLSHAIAGLFVGPYHADRDALRRPWLSLVEQHPALIVNAGNVGDVAKTIEFASVVLAN